MIRRLVVSGSIANDYLMRFPGRFSEHLLAGRLDRVSLSFLVQDLEIRRGGVAANICYGLSLLGQRPVLVGSVGSDFLEYGAQLQARGVNISSVRVSHTLHTARFLCTTDCDQNQIASFYGGAMVEARDIQLQSIIERDGIPDLVLLAPDDPEAMLQYSRECRKYGYRFAADPSQQLATFDRAEARSFVDGARIVFTNEYESALLIDRTGWSRCEVLEHVDLWVSTLGCGGARIESRYGATLEVPAVLTETVVDPTGAGDAFRAGFLFGATTGLDLERSAQVGCLLATAALETIGTQEYVLSRAALSNRAARNYGELAAAEIEAVLRV